MPPVRHAAPARTAASASLPAHATDARKRSALAVRALQRRARALAECEYKARPRSLPPPPSPGERKKRMRNKSAFISRQTQRHYERLLAAHVQEAERDRDSVLQSCIENARVAATLRAHEKALAARLAALATPSLPAPSAPHVSTPVPPAPPALLFDPCALAPSPPPSAQPGGRRMSHILDDALEMPAWGATPLCSFY